MGSRIPNFLKIFLNIDQKILSSNNNKKMAKNPISGNFPQFVENFREFSTIFPKLWKFPGNFPQFFQNCGKFPEIFHKLWKISGSRIFVIFDDKISDQFSEKMLRKISKIISSWRNSVSKFEDYFSKSQVAIRRFQISGMFLIWKSGKRNQVFEKMASFIKEIYNLNLRWNQGIQKIFIRQFKFFLNMQEEDASVATSSI